jgi:glycosyltransferase involved in cell wall biosynthesis
MNATKSAGPPGQGRRRIVIVAPVLAHYDAVSASALDMASALMAVRGLDVRLITLRSDFPEFPSIELVSGLPEMLLNGDFLAADLIIYHFGIYSPLVDAVAVGNGRAKQVIVFHNITPIDLVNAETRSLLERSFRQLDSMSGVDEFWADSQENLDVLISRGFQADAARVIPISVDGIQRRPLLAKAADSIRVLYVGRFVASKGVIDLLSAVEVIVATGETDFSVALAGSMEWSDRDYVAELQHRIKERKIGDRVSLLGTISDSELATLYHESHILAMPSYHEGFCKPVIEALRAGCVPVHYTSGNLRRIVGGLGKGVEPGDVAGFSSALSEAILEVRRVLACTPGARLQLDVGALTAEEFTLKSLEHTACFESDRVGQLVHSAAAGLLTKSAIDKPGAFLQT